jgi:hypothetical protein
VAGKQAHYLFTVKANQPTLLARCARLAWHNVRLSRLPDRLRGAAVLLIWPSLYRSRALTVKGRVRDSRLV